MFLILIASVCVVTISFMCSLLEAVFLTITNSSIGVMVKEGKRSGKLLEHLKEDINRPIAAILALNTITQTMGSALIASMVQEKTGSTLVAIASGLLSICILVFSEFLPKILGATHWKTLAPFVAYAIQLLIFIFYPIVRLSEIFGALFARPDQTTVSREEMIVAADIGVEEGTVHKKESAIIKNLFMLSKMFVSDIMTPRSVMFALEANETVEEVSQKFKPIRFSRIPVYETSLDNIIGLTHRYKILEALSHDLHDKNIRDLTTQIDSVPERMTVANLIDMLVKKKEHLALAVDEYGIVTGLVTLEDAIETLLGVEIVDEFDNITDMRQYALDQWQIRKNSLRKPS
jgi:CBS domain containing-hemolysin-like protein